MYVTKAIIGLNLLAFLLTVSTNGGLRLGPRGSDWVTNGFAIDALGEWWRIITGGFLHANPIHIGMNMWVLWSLGRLLEKALGSVRFGAIYGASLIAGSFGALLLDPDRSTVGASGAVYGLMGVLVIAQKAHGRSIWDTGLGTSLLINFAVTFAVPFISIGGHVGGFLGGLAAGWLVYEAPRATGKKWIDLVGTTGLAAVFFVGGLWAATTWVDPIF